MNEQSILRLIARIADVQRLADSPDMGDLHSLAVRARTLAEFWSMVEGLNAMRPGFAIKVARVMEFIDNAPLPRSDIPDLHRDLYATMKAIAPWCESAIMVGGDERMVMAMRRVLLAISRYELTYPSLLENSL